MKKERGLKHLEKTAKIESMIINSSIISAVIIALIVAIILYIK